MLVMSPACVREVLMPSREVSWKGGKEGRVVEDEDRDLLFSLYLFPFLVCVSGVCCVSGVGIRIISRSLS